MRRLSLVPAIVLLTAGVAQAELKLGYVDLQRALAEVGEGQSASTRSNSINVEVARTS